MKLTNLDALEKSVHNKIAKKIMNGDDFVSPDAKVIHKNCCYIILDSNSNVPLLIQDNLNNQTFILEKTIRGLEWIQHAINKYYAGRCLTANQMKQIFKEVNVGY